MSKYKQPVMRGLFLLKLRDNTLWVHMWGLMVWNGSRIKLRFVSWSFYNEGGLRKDLNTKYSVRFTTLPRAQTGNAGFAPSTD